MNKHDDFVSDVLYLSDVYNLGFTKKSTVLEVRTKLGRIYPEITGEISLGQVKSIVAREVISIKTKILLEQIRLIE